MEPFLKWAGGKRWLVNCVPNIFPKDDFKGQYIEPFLGGGAVFFHLKPKKGILSDINKELIISYNVIKQDWANLLDVLSWYQKKHSEEFYYLKRSSKPRVDLQIAARFIYLNRTCWNGLYRVNQQGKFNVPIGTKTKVILPNDNFKELSTLLTNQEINLCDFESSINKANDGDFIFIDPPYTVKHNLNGFVKYNEKIFSWQDQVRLRNCIKKAKDRGAICLVLNADHASIKELYKGMGRKIVLERSSVLAGKAIHRGTFTELAIKI